MILYQLQCDDGHEFEGWFQNSRAFDEQAGAGAVMCPQCGSVDVSKALMAPHIGPKGNAGNESPARPRDDAQARQMVRMASEIRDHVEKNFEYVGDKFALEARRIHHGEAKERGIYGEASAAETKALTEEGIEIAPLPGVPKSKVN